MSVVRRESVTCCIAGGGPAGMMLGFLLARAGVAIAVLEKHADFFRDFRGDTIHPSTLELMHELGLIERFLERPHSELEDLAGQIGDVKAILADFRHLPTRSKFIAVMPQWDFLDFLAEAARPNPKFRLVMQAEVTGLLEEGERITGVRAETPDGPLEVAADLVVGADGRHSTVRQSAPFEVMDLGAPMDVLWLRLPRWPEDGGQTLGRIQVGGLFIMIDRRDYWQCAFVIRKGSFEEWKSRGLDAFRAEIVRFAPQFADRMHEVKDWDDVKLLTVVVDRVRRWHRPGLLLIGDAAHAMSPIGGVGVNLAVQDAVAAANILALPLRNHAADESDLARVQRRRELPTRITQALQLFIQNRVLTPVLAGTPVKPPLAFRMAGRYPLLRRLPARIMGMGFRPEHVRV